MMRIEGFRRMADRPRPRRGPRRQHPVMSVAAAAIVLGLFGAPAAGSEPESPDGVRRARSSASTPPHLLSPSSDPRPQLPGMITSARGRHSFPADLIRVLGSRGDPNVIIGRVLLAAVCNAAGVQTAAADPEDRYVVLLPAGDLDADGVEDGLEHHVLDDWDTGEFDVSVAAVSGATGAELWRLQSDEALQYAFPAGDLDGEPGDDVFAVEESGALLEWAVEFSAITGADAEPLWSRAYEATGAGANADFLAGAFAVSDFAIPWRASGDVDGDGRSDLLLGRFDEAGGWAAVTGDWISVAQFEFLSGATGAPISSFDAWGHGWFPDAWPVQDLTGDGLDDVVVVSIDWDLAWNSRLLIQAYPGKGGNLLWEELAVAQSPPHVMGLDFTSHSGTSDLLIQTWGWDQVTEEDYFALRALSGEDGSELWGRRFPGAGEAVAGGDRDGDGAEDLLGVSWEFADEITSTVFAVNGRDGETGWSISAAEDWIVGLPGDLTGDGTEDITATSWDFDWDSGSFRVVGASEAVSGADGSVLWSRPPEEGFLIPAGADLEGPDLDDDARPDVLALRFGPASDTVSSLSGVSGAPRWGPADVGGYLIVLAPGRTSREAALFESVETSAEDVTRARAGATGAEIWERVHA